VEGGHFFFFHGDYDTGVGIGVVALEGDQPLTTSSSAAVDAGAMIPPGHIQKEKTPLWSTCSTKAVRSRREVGGFVSVLYMIDKRLRVFDAYAQRKRFGGDGYFLLKQQVKNIPGRMTGSEYNGASLELFSVICYNLFYSIVL